MTYSGCDTPFFGGLDAGIALGSRCASLLIGIDVTANRMWIRNMAGPRIAGVFGSSVPNGRRLRS